MDTGYEVFASFYDPLTQNVDYPARATYFDSLIRQYKKSKGNVLLDLGCGTGTMAELMTEKGYDVLGVDYSCGMLNQAMNKKLEKNLPIQYVQQDMRELELYGTVDVTLCTLDSLNHLPCLEDVQTVFQNVAKYTEHGGVFIFDMNTLYKHRNLLGNEVYVYQTDDVYCVWENALEEDQRTVDITLELFQRVKRDTYRRQTEYVTERAYTTEEIQKSLEKANFHVLHIYAADTEQPLQPDSDRMVVIARKE